ncbi:hypothetical protein DFJ58DRAFT_718154 [Suillus subalutaceus]|uniref:uncharacterized protein n=1 Tax=Suillus subalutaceus TaxID=48586 RepID=UPI001B88010C|nr:uncharacterized protein DFJ58DRAFT_718154 [Suillus subalutaceus]KAG1841563.1 hypothetical protein DFJ58DRAFT_718154 [Suillus subalutaceus]
MPGSNMGSSKIQPCSLHSSSAEVLSVWQAAKDDLTALLSPIWDLGRDYDNCVATGDCNARKTVPEPHIHPRTLLAKNSYTPTSTLAQAIMQSSVLLTELVIVREWLHDTAPQPQHPEARILERGSGKELDTDAMNRSDGQSLAADDAGSEKILAQALYSFVHASRKTRQPWRAASIRGSLLFQCSRHHPRISDLLTANEQRDDAEDAEGWQGNPRRKIWKSTCARAALNPNLPDPKRILYAALAPFLQTFSVLKSACRTWEDYLWAQVSILCEEKQTAEMIKLVSQNMPSPPFQEEDAAKEEEWEKEVTSTSDTLGSVHVEDGPTADHAFHVSQLAIIPDRINFDPESSEYPTMTHFFSHFCLYLRMIDIPVPPLATQAAGQRELIAMCAGALGDSAVERYAMFLTSLELTAYINERRLALTRSCMVAVVAAKQTIDGAFEGGETCISQNSCAEHYLQLLPQMKGLLPSVIALQATPSDIELLLLRFIEWTTFEDGSYDTALGQATDILRYFLGAGRVSLSKNLFFTIWDSLDRVVECQSLEVSIMNRDTRAAWLSDYKGLMDQAYDAVVKLLTSDWMMPDGTGERRSRELTRVRQIYVPELILRLHVMLYASRENLKRALELADIVVDSRYKLHDDFLHLDGRRFGEYLDAVRRATIAGLEGGGSGSFKIILS